MTSRLVPPGYLGPFGSRPRLVTSIAIGLAMGLLLAVVPSSLDVPTRALLAWDVSCVAYVALILREISSRDASYIRAVAAAQDPGQGAILAFVLVLAATSLAAVAGELSAAKVAHGLAAPSRILLAVATVAISWFVTQLIFALRYGHEYDAPDHDGDPTRLEQGGLAFSGEQPPDYWDFVHFAVVIGVASQTADIAFTSKRMHRIGTVHGLVAFTFNTVILALTINVLAGLLWRLCIARARTAVAPMNGVPYGVEPSSPRVTASARSTATIELTSCPQYPCRTPWHRLGSTGHVSPSCKL